MGQGDKKRYEVYIDAAATVKYVVKANSKEEALEEAEKIVNDEKFWERFRADCEILEPTVSRDVYNLTDETME